MGHATGNGLWAPTESNVLDVPINAKHTHGLPVPIDAEHAAPSPHVGGNGVDGSIRSLPPPLLVHGRLPSWSLPGITGKSPNKKKIKVKVSCQVLICSVYCLCWSIFAVNKRLCYQDMCVYLLFTPLYACIEPLLFRSIDMQ